MRQIKVHTHQPKSENLVLQNFGGLLLEVQCARRPCDCGSWTWKWVIVSKAWVSKFYKRESLATV